MEPLEDFSDERQKAWCIHCGGWANHLELNWDHVPTKALLSRPLPAHTPQVLICASCNRSYSQDEEYFVTFLSCVLAGTTEPISQANPRVQRALARNLSLGARIEAGRRPYRAVGGQDGAVWIPESERIERVVLKNARGHAYYELGEPMLDPPESVWAIPLTALTEDERKAFAEVLDPGWAEVGSRMLDRQASGADMDEGWVIVQHDVYRYAVLQDGGVTVRSIMRNYLATEVTWS